MAFEHRVDAGNLHLACGNLLGEGVAPKVEQWDGKRVAAGAPRPGILQCTRPKPLMSGHSTWVTLRVKSFRSGPSVPDREDGNQLQEVRQIAARQGVLQSGRCQ